MRALVIAGAAAVVWAIELRTPAGRPAAWKHETIAQVQRGEISGALRTAVLPAARALATARTPRI
jgi:hypothetical protein